MLTLRERGAKAREKHGIGHSPSRPKNTNVSHYHGCGMQLQIGRMGVVHDTCLASCPVEPNVAFTCIPWFAPWKGGLRRPRHHALVHLSQLTE